MSLGYEGQAASISRNCSNTAKERYQKENSSNPNENINKPAEAVLEQEELLI